MGQEGLRSVRMRQRFLLISCGDILLVAEISVTAAFIFLDRETLMGAEVSEGSQKAQDLPDN